MENYEDFCFACGALAELISDRDVCSVKTLIMAAASIDVPAVVQDVCFIIDRFTGCGFDFLLNVYDDSIKVSFESGDDLPF